MTPPAEAGNPMLCTREYFDRLWLEQRLMDPVVPDTTLRLFGETFASPVMTAALSHLKNDQPGAEDPMVAYGKGAALAGCVHWIGMGDDDQFRAVVNTGARTVRIVKPYAEEEAILSRLRAAEEAGALAVGMDIDHWYDAVGDCDVVLGETMRPKSLSQLRSYAEATKLPFVIKGVLSARDAKAAADIGAKGIVVSHHNGRMKFAVPPLLVLPEIVKAVGDRLAVFVDCGVTSGADAYKALALGATAVCVGAHLIPFTMQGSAAVCGRLREMTASLKGLMAWTGVADLRSFDASVLHPLP